MGRRTLILPSGERTIGDVHADYEYNPSPPAPSNSAIQEWGNKMGMAGHMPHPRPKPSPRGERYQ